MLYRHNFFFNILCRPTFGGFNAIQIFAHKITACYLIAQRFNKYVLDMFYNKLNRMSYLPAY